MRASSRCCAACATSSTARLNAASLALDGRVKPLNLRTNCSAEARISASVAGGAKLWRVLMFRHMRCPRESVAARWRTSPLDVRRELPLSLVCPDDAPLTELAHGDGRVCHAVGEAPLVVIPGEHTHQPAVHDLRLREVEGGRVGVVVEVDRD